MELLTGWTGVILGFSGLIFVHELGHFLLAKWNGVQVHVFSIGMGPYIFSFTHNGTVYALSLIPLGGYVKMMGQDDLNADLGETKNPADFRNKRAGQKASILVAGAAFNIILTLVIFTLCYSLGTKFQSPRIGNIVPGKPLSKATLIDSKNTPANLKKGDRIVEVNGVNVKSMMDVMMFSVTAPKGEPVVLRVEREDATPRAVYVNVDTVQDKKMGAPGIGVDPLYNDVKLALGFSTEYYVYVSDDPAANKDLRGMPAALSGKFKKGDRILAIEDRSDPAHPIIHKMDNHFALMNATAESEGKERVFILERDKEKIEVPLKAVRDEKSGDLRYGLLQGALYHVTAIDPGSEAYAGGLREGNFVTGFAPDAPDQKPWKSGTLMWFKTTADETKQTAKVQVPDFDSNSANGVFTQEEPDQEIFRASGFTDALGTAWDDIRHYTYAMFATIRGLIFGWIDPKNLSGPVGIGKSIYLASSGQSFLSFLWWLGFISLNLGVMQLLPIPLLDGFHLVLVLAEKIKGRPVSAKVQVAFFYAGMAIIGLLFTFVMWNDLGFGK